MQTPPDQRDPKPLFGMPYPKRAIKACCNCRRNKTKCDGERPCNACRKKGIPDEKCVDGCPPCRRLRVQCDGGIPCAQCLESGMDCYDEAASPNINSNGPTNKSTKPPVRLVPEGRAKLACLACRRDNKKCDDNRPCTRCILRSEECIHVERSPRTIKYRCVNCRKDHKKCEDNRPCQNCVEMNIECVDVPRKAAGATRVRIACINCRRNKVQCNQEWPCRFCVRRGLECTVPPTSCEAASLEHGAGSPTCSNLSGRDIEVLDGTSIGTAEESQTENTGMPPLLSLNLPDYDGPGASQDSAVADTHSQLQGPSDPSDIQTNADLITSTNDMQNHSYGFADSLHLSDQLSFQGTHLQFPHLSGKETTQDIYTTTELCILGSRNKYGPRSIHRRDNHQPGSVGMDAPIYPEFSFIPQNFPSQTSTCAELTGISPGFGSGTFDAPAAISGPSQWHDPVPVPMPVSMTIEIPQPGISTQNVESTVTTGQVQVHPQLQHSAEYLTSESKSTHVDVDEQRRRNENEHIKPSSAKTRSRYETRKAA